jgi:5,10-methylene-tetrahydrofolate dehydrogenase/methenyl tetrahydrofolate cyclohydrolase
LGIYADIKFGQNWEVGEILEEIYLCNNDKKCLGILVQLPINNSLRAYQRQILDAIHPSKDVDGLGSTAFGRL